MTLFKSGKKFNMNSSFEGKYGPLLIAEIGGNHEGDFDYAKKLTRAAIESGVDVVKFQIYTGDTLVSSLESPDRNSHFKKFELSREQHEYLASMVTEAGLKYSASVWNIEALEWIDKYVSIYKVGSGDLTAFSILDEIAERGKPVILSTGLSTEQEVIATVKHMQSLNKRYASDDFMCLLQCTSMYPISYKDANLSVMQRLKHLTKLSIGYSDHTEGTSALTYAIAMGAEVLEFHFTDSREGKQFRDHKVSLVPKEIQELISELEFIYRLKGDPVKRPLEIEVSNDHPTSFRRAVYPAQDLPVGKVISKEDLILLRPNVGIDARDLYSVVGKTVKSPVKKHQKLEWSLLD